MSIIMSPQYPDIEETSLAIPTVVPKPTFDQPFGSIVDAHNLRNVSMETWGKWLARILWVHWLGLNRWVWRADWSFHLHSLTRPPTHSNENVEETRTLVSFVKEKNPPQFDDAITHILSHYPPGYQGTYTGVAVILHSVYYAISDPDKLTFPSLPFGVKKHVMHKEDPCNGVARVASQSFAAAMYIAVRWLLDESAEIRDFWYAAFHSTFHHAIIT
jgi:hypothetical protein